MKLELTRGCIAGWLGADGIAEHEMDEQMREKVFEKIFDFLKTQPNGLNHLMQHVLEIYGEYEWDDEPCECCGDTVDTWTLILPVEHDSESELKEAIIEGLDKGVAEDFNPEDHLKSLKDQS